MKNLQEIRSLSWCEAQQISWHTDLTLPCLACMPVARGPQTSSSPIVETETYNSDKLWLPCYGTTTQVPFGGQVPNRTWRVTEGAPLSWTYHATIWAATQLPENILHAPWVYKGSLTLVDPYLSHLFPSLVTASISLILFKFGSLHPSAQHSIRYDLYQDLRCHQVFIVKK